MKIFETREIREIDQYTIHHEPVASVDLMERAAHGCTSWIVENLPSEKHLVVFTGPGNNGGDGWAIARQLASREGYSVRLYHLNTGSGISPDAEINRRRLAVQALVPIAEINSEADFPLLSPREVVIDALFGSGLSRPLTGLAASLIKHINAAGSKIISIDIPSGLMGEDNTGNDPHSIVKATVTLTFQFPKRAFFYSENGEYTGKWVVIPIGLHQGIIDEKKTDFFYVTREEVAAGFRKRKTFSHKGTYGHALLISGQYGMMGAAILAARSCLRSGVGLLTTHVPELGYQVMQPAVPESIFSIDPSREQISTCPPLYKYSAVGAGPGIGTEAETASAIERLLKKSAKPLVLDADALNILSQRPGLLSSIPENTILTPHPGEFDRLAGKSANACIRNQTQIEFSKTYRVILLLKGAYTSVSLPNGKCFFNSTGNPGMATAGCGDVLTGMILSLLAQGYAPDEAAITGAYLHGLAGDLSAAEHGELALIASDVVDQIGNAFKIIERHDHSA
ncbi:MAG: NAD(P)H-hydrate dehydratase [Bacteroidales bacterium]